MELQNRSYSSHHSQRPNHDQIDTNMNEVQIDIINVKIIDWIQRIYA
jgi:hypothetical protein